MLSLHEISAADGLNSGIFDSTTVPETLIDEAIDNVIKEHNISFLPVRSSFIAKRNLDSNYFRPSVNQM